MDVLQGLTPDKNHAGTAPVWENLPIHPDRLPVIPEHEAQGLSTLYLKVMYRRLFISSGIIVTLFCLLFSIFGWNAWAWFGLLIPPWIAVGYYHVGRLFYSRKYLLRQHDITYYSGWIWRDIVTVPYSRIQHCETNQGPIEKWYGLATLEVFTAGKQQHDMAIPGLLLDDAERIKYFLLHKQESTEIAACAEES